MLAARILRSPSSLDYHQSRTGTARVSAWRLGIKKITHSTKRAKTHPGMRTECAMRARMLSACVGDRERRADSLNTASTLHSTEKDIWRSMRGYSSTTVGSTVGISAVASVAGHILSSS